MMVGDVSIVYEPAAEWFTAGALSQHVLVGRSDALNDSFEISGHILREMSAVCSRITDELVLFIETLRQTKGVFCADTVESVGMALQLGQIIEQGWWDVACLGL